MESRCKCGAVTIDIATDEYNSINCHCNMCRENYGSAFTTWVSLNSGKVSIPNIASITEYAVSESSNSYFCSKCGTSIFAKDTRYPEVVAFLAGTIYGTTLREPSGEYFYSDKARWYKGVSSIQKFGGESGFEKIENT